MVFIIWFYFKIEFWLWFYVCRDWKKFYRFYVSNRIKIEFVLVYGIWNKMVLFLFFFNIILKIFYLFFNEFIEIYLCVIVVDILL